MPTTNQVHIDTALTNVSVAYKNAHYIADTLAPAIGVRKQSDKYFVYDTDRDRFRKTNDLRAPGTEAAEVDFALSTDSYFCDDHALESTIADEERENADPPLAPAIDRTEYLMDKIHLNKEIELAELVSTDPGVQSETLSGTDQWSDFDNSDPLDDVEQGRATVLDSVQELPNTLVLPYEVYAKVRLHPLIKEMMASAQLGAATAESLAQIFDVEQVLVPRAFRNTANPGQAAQMEYIWGKNALLCHVPTRPGLKTVGLAYTFVWSAAPGSLDGRLVETWREPRRKADMLRVQRYYDQKLIAPGAAYVWKSAVV
jgi:hypothetical protein